MAVTHDKDIDRAYGRAIKHLRGLKHGQDGRRWTQRDLAIAIHLSPKNGAITISRIETGVTKISENRKLDLALGLDVSIDTIDTVAHRFLLADIDEAAASAVGDETMSATASRFVRNMIAGSQAQDNARRRSEIELQIQQRQNTTRKFFDWLSTAQQDAIHEFLEPFIEQGHRIQSFAPLGTAPDTNTAGLTMEQRLDLHNRSLMYDVTNTLGSATLGAGVGAAAGGSAAALVMTLVATSATASTGAAIGSLTGAAATSATLAWLGGGSLAAGGLGVAGGALVLASIVTLPALIAVGGVLAYQGHKMRAQAATDAERLDQALDSLHDTDDALKRVWDWMKREQRTLEELTSAGRIRLRTLRRDLDLAEQSIVLEEVSAEFSDNFTALTQIAVSCISVLGLPILADLNPDPADDDKPTERAEWINLVLDDAKAHLTRLGGSSAVDEQVHGVSDSGT